jgi:hypothetical protein
MRDDRFALIGLSPEVRLELICPISTSKRIRVDGAFSWSAGEKKMELAKGPAG